MDKFYRHTQIREVLRAAPIATQSELRDRLARRGIEVTQATLSRDMEEMGVVKTREGYRLPEVAAPAPPTQVSLGVILKEFARDVRLAGMLVIVKTHPGNAHSVAVALDAEGWPEAAGTVAGDDTIFIATARSRDAVRIRKKILELLAG